MRMRPKPSSFQAQKFFFGLQAAAVAGERAVCAQDPVAGNDDGNRVVVIGLANRAKSLRAAYLPRNFSVTAGCTVRNAPQRLPARLLKWSADQVQRAGEFTQLTTEVSVELLLVRLQMSARFNPEFVLCQFARRRFGQLAPVKLHAAQPLLRGRNQQRSDRGLHHRVVHISNHGRGRNINSESLRKALLRRFALIDSRSLSLLSVHGPHDFFGYSERRRNKTVAFPLYS